MSSTTPAAALQPTPIRVTIAGKQEKDEDKKPLSIPVLVLSLALGSVFIALVFMAGTTWSTAIDRAITIGQMPKGAARKLAARHNVAFWVWGVVVFVVIIVLGIAVGLLFRALKISFPLNITGAITREVSLPAFAPVPERSQYTTTPLPTSWSFN